VVHERWQPLTGKLISRQDVKILILTDFGKKKRRRFDGEEIKKNVT
jgi:hypothetical protein